MDGSEPLFQEIVHEPSTRLSALHLIWSASMREDPIHPRTISPNLPLGGMTLLCDRFPLVLVLP